jgi:hypothetical protein
MLGHSCFVLLPEISIQKSHISYSCYGNASTVISLFSFHFRIVKEFVSHLHLYYLISNFIVVMKSVTGSMVLMESYGDCLLTVNITLGTI